MLHDFDPDAPGVLGDGIFGLPHTPDNARVVVVGVPFEATVSSGRGTAQAPNRIREASLQVDLHDPLVDAPWRDGIAMLPESEADAIRALDTEARALAEPVIAAGGPTSPELQAACTRVDALCDRMNQWVDERTSAILAAGQIPAIVGGDHSVAFGAMRAAARHCPGVGILHIDAHADLREAYEGFRWSHASVLYNVHELVPDLGHIVQVGLRDFGVAEAERIVEWSDLTAYTDHEIAWEQASGEPWMRIAARILRPLPERVWVTLDIDGLDPGHGPHTGTPVPGGLSWHEVTLLLQLLAQDHRIIGFDLVEVGDGDWDANVGARLLYRLASWAIHTHRRQ